MFAPARMGLKVHRTVSIKKRLVVAFSTRRAMFLSIQSSPTIHPKPPTGVITMSICPTPVKQFLVVQGQEPFWFHGGRSLVPYFSTVTSLIGPRFHCVLYTAFQIVAFSRLFQYAFEFENSRARDFGSF